MEDPSPDLRLDYRGLTSRCLCWYHKLRVPVFRFGSLDMVKISKLLLNLFTLKFKLRGRKVKINKFK